MTKENKRFIFIIDTDEYSGNFERDMCAYITGHIGQCGVGEEYAQMFTDKYGDFEDSLFFEKIEDRPDDNGCFRPCSIYPTIDRFNDGIGGHYSVNDKWDDVVTRYREYWRKEYEHNNLKESKEKSETGTPGRFQAYESVAIFFYERPTDEELKILIERALEFPAIYAEKEKHILEQSMNIIGFRMICKTTTTTEEILNEDFVS